MGGNILLRVEAYQSLYKTGRKPLDKGTANPGKTAWHKDINEKHRECQTLKGKEDSVTTTYCAHIY